MEIGIRGAKMPPFSATTSVCYSHCGTRTFQAQSTASSSPKLICSCSLLSVKLSVKLAYNASDSHKSNLTLGLLHLSLSKALTFIRPIYSYSFLSF